MIAFGFHDIVEDGHVASPVATGHTTLYTLKRSELRRHLQAIRASTGQPSVRRIDRPEVAGPCGPVLLTFDDGALSAYTCVARELEVFGWPGYFFVTSDWIGRPGFVDRHQIRELHELGHVIGSHSRSHPDRMSHLRFGELVRQWSDSCAVLGDIIGQPVKVASVPGGYYSRQVGRAAAESGIEVLFTSEPTARAARVDGCLILGRYSVRQFTPASVAAAIAAGAWWPRFRQAAMWFTMQGAKSAIGPWYPRVRRMLLGAALNRAAMRSRVEHQ
jgi:hypothetical protein